MSGACVVFSGISSLGSSGISGAGKGEIRAILFRLGSVDVSWSESDGGGSDKGGGGASNAARSTEKFGKGSVIFAGGFSFSGLLTNSVFGVSNPVGGGNSDALMIHCSTGAAGKICA